MSFGIRQNKTILQLITFKGLTSCVICLKAIESRHQVKIDKSVFLLHMKHYFCGRKHHSHQAEGWWIPVGHWNWYSMLKSSLLNFDTVEEIHDMVLIACKWKVCEIIRQFTLIRDSSLNDCLGVGRPSTKWVSRCS